MMKKGIEMIRKVLESFFGWKTILITNNMEEYAHVRGKLIDNGIKSKTKINGNRFKNRNIPAVAFSSVYRSSYEIFVKKEDEHKAYEVIRKSTIKEHDK